jgi:hypothetical protein
MAKKGAKIEEVELLARVEEILERKLDKIIEKILLKLDPTVEKTVEEKVAAHLDKIQDKQLYLEKENDRLRTRLDQMETEARLPNLVISGLPEPDNTHGSKGTAEREATQAVLQLCNSTLGLSVTEADISLAYRIPKKGKDKHRTVIVKFLGMRTRNLVYGARFLLKKTSVYINEHLSTNTAHTYAKARNLVKDGRASSTWTAGGAIFVRLSDKLGVKPMKIPNMKALEKLLPTEDLSLTNPLQTEDSPPTNPSGLLQSEATAAKPC